MRGKLEIPLLFNRAVTRTNILSKEQEKKIRGDRKVTSDQVDSYMFRMTVSIQRSSWL